MANSNLSRWGISCWSRRNRSHLFNRHPGGKLLVSACGRLTELPRDIQPEDAATERCSLCLKSKPKG